MKLYYTTPTGYLGLQTKPNLSLGGYQSITPLPNSTVGNLFGDISMYTVKNSTQNQYIGLMLKNETIATVHSILIYFVYPTTCYSLMRVAAVTPAVDTDLHSYIENVGSIQSKPIYATFSAADGVTNAVNIGDLAAGGVLGIWFERELLESVIKTDQNNIYVVDPSNPYRYLPVDLSKEDSINIVLSWT